MLNLRKPTITKKIGLLSICAAVGMLIIILISLAFFSKIGEINGVTDASNQYGVYYYKAKVAFQQFVGSNGSEHLDRFIENVETMNQLNGSIGRVHALLGEFSNSTELLDAYKQRYGYSTGLEELIELLKALKGKPILAKLVANCEKSNQLSTQWLKIGKQYVTVDSKAQKGIEHHMAALGEQMEIQLVEFHDILEAIVNSLKSTVIKLFITIGVCMMILLFAVTFLVTRSIIKPLKATVAFAESLSQGDLTQKMVIKNRDELGEMGGSLNEMIAGLAQMLGEIKTGTETLSSASVELSTISEQMTNDTKDTSAKATDVTVSSESMGDAMRIVAAAMEEASNNSQMVATAAEEMSSTIGEISENAERARTISADANTKTSEATVRMNELGQAAEGIGKVVETITDISEQVNLLALNATIEAARAGEAGKGFAVVANEIKELARQTADATQEIKGKIENIQGTTSSTIAQTQEISGVIVEVNDVISGIASAVEEQSAATREIAYNIVKTSQGIQEVSEHVSNTAGAATTINGAISDMSQSTLQIEENSSQVNQSSMALASLAEKLNEMVARFHL